MPTTVVRIEESAFRGCHWLNSITVPGCTDFGYKVFADCCSLQWVYANGGGVNNIGSATKLGDHLFVDCINLANMTILLDTWTRQCQSYVVGSRRDAFVPQG